MKRNYSIDLMRVFLSLCVIAVHSLTYYGIKTGVVRAFVTSFLLQSDGCFFLLSGYFNLEKEYNTPEEIKNYYKHKILHILFPFMAFLFVWTVWDYVHINNNFNVLEILSSFYQTFMVGASYDHMWFMYPLFGLLLSTPFLSRLLHNLNEKELKYIWYITLGWDVICYYICYDLGMQFRFLNWFIDGWMIYYFAGYYYRRVIAKESKVKWAIIGISCYVLTCVAQLSLDNFAGTADMQPMFILFCVSCLMFFDKAIKITNKTLCRIIGFLSKNTFMIYLFHMRAMEYALRKMPINGQSLGDGLLLLVSTFVFALICAFVANTLMKPIQKFIEKKWIKA